MSKNLVFQLNVPHNIPDAYLAEMYSISERNARRYAEKYNADYYVIRDTTSWEPVAGKHIWLQKLQVYNIPGYDKYLYFDSDYIIKETAPNLFELPEPMFAAAYDDGKNAAKIAEALGTPVEQYFNAGMMYFTKDFLDRTRTILVDTYLTRDWTWGDQDLLNRMIFDLGISRTYLNSNDWNSVKNTFASYGDHYAAKRKKLWDATRYGL